MFKNLSPGAIGIRNLALSDAINLAKQTGFGGIDFSIHEAAQLADQNGLAYVRDLFDQAGILPGAWGLPVAWQDDDQWQTHVKDLPKLAAVGRELGCTRTLTWCPPSSPNRPFDENFAWHVERFGVIAKILKEEGCRFGLEFIGPQTMRKPGEHVFIYTLEGMMDLTKAIGTGNVGLLLDAWHLYTSGGDVSDMDKLTNEDIIIVHVNDAPEGLAMHEYIDQDRRLPTESGVMDLASFMKKLTELQYDGPVTPEPFSKRVNAIEDPLEAARLTAVYNDRMWEQR